MPDEVLDRETTDKPAVPKGQAETITITKAEWERSQRETQEAKKSEKYWADRARGGKDEPEEEEETAIDTSDLLPVPKVTGDKDVDEAIFSDPDKWVDAISKGPKAIQALIRKEGFVTAKEVADIAAKVARRTVDIERGKITTDNRLMTAFPELADNKSELFKATAEEYTALVEFEPAAKKSPSTLYAAARIAAAKLKAAAPKHKDDDEEYGYERPDEEERRTRVKAQDGSRNGRGRGDEGEDSIGPQAKAVLEGMGLSEEKYRASQKILGRTARKR